jgi:UDP-N-acetylmuramate dehydrogenase
MGRLRITENVPLAPMTTLGVGGPARYFTECRTETDVKAAVDFAKTRGVDLFVLGGGSNLLVADAGFNGLAAKIDLHGITAHDDGLIDAAAGEDWDAFVKFAVEKDLAGLECMSGIPGKIGGTPVQNVGAYGQEVSETIVKVRCLDRQTNEIVELSSDDCCFSYRKSIFNSEARERYIVLAVTFRLTIGGRPQLKYKELSDHFHGREPTLDDVRDAVIAIRRRKSMVIESGDPNARSAGSFFKNPIVLADVYKALAETSEATVPHFPAGDGHVKIPAAWLIEQSGFYKGFQFGNAGISSNHSLAIINRGSASANEVVGLMKTIQMKVSQKFGIELNPEPVFLGF